MGNFFDPDAAETDSKGAFFVDNFQDLRNFYYGSTNDDGVSDQFGGSLTVKKGSTILRQSKWKKSCLLKKVSKQCSVKM